MKKFKRLVPLFFFAVLFVVACGTDNMDTISDVNINGNTAGNLNNGGAVAQQEDWIYYSEIPNPGLYKVKTDGSEQTKLNDDVPMDLNVFGDWVYYNNYADGEPISIKVKTDETERTLDLDTASLISLEFFWP